MKELLSTVSSKGQLTIPAEVRQTLGLRQGDKVSFTIQNGQALLRRTGSVVEATAGALKSTAPAKSTEELRAAAAEAIAERTRSAQ